MSRKLIDQYYISCKHATFIIFGETGVCVRACVCCHLGSPPPAYLSEDGGSPLMG